MVATVAYKTIQTHQHFRNLYAASSTPKCTNLSILLSLMSRQSDLNSLEDLETTYDLCVVRLALAGGVWNTKSASPCLHVLDTPIFGILGKGLGSTGHTRSAPVLNVVSTALFVF
jgi:hypothetical protein